MTLRLSTFVIPTLFWPLLLQAQLAVTVNPPKVLAQKTVVSLAMSNALLEPIKSARAVCFVLNDQGKVVGQRTEWVIGGTRERPPLGPGSTNQFHFVIATSPGSTTNLTARVNFTRVVLGSGDLADVNRAIRIKPASE